MFIFVFGLLLYVTSSLAPGPCIWCGRWFSLLTILVILLLHRLSATQNAMVFALPINCDSFLDSTTCTYYICESPSHPTCPNVTDTVYESIGAAMTAAVATSPSDSDSQFLLFGDLSSEQYVIPRQLPRVSFVGSGNGVHTTAIKCPKFESSAAPQKLALQRLRMTAASDSCLKIASSSRLEVSFDDILSQGSISLTGGSNSRFTFHLAQISGRSSSNLTISGSDAYVSFTSSLVDINATLLLKNSTTFYETDVSWMASVDTHLAPSASGSISQSRFGGSTSFNFETSIDNPFVPPMGSSDRQLIFINNNCSHSVAFIGAAVSADINYNFFVGTSGLWSLSEELGIDSKVAKQMDHNSPSLILFARCAANITVLGNTFADGTFYIDFPESANECGILNPYVAPYTRITKNRFGALFSMKRDLCPKFSTGEETCEPLRPAVSTSAIGLAQRANMPAHYASLVVDLSENWWGTSHGPWVCCNSNERSSIDGAFTSNFFNLSRWCTDENCHQTSDKVLSLKCITTGCEAHFSHFMLPAITTFILVALFMLLVALIYTMMRLKIDFKTVKIQTTPQDELVDKLRPRWMVCLATSSVGFLFCMIVIGGILATSAGVDIVPWQLKLRPVSIVAYLLLFVTAGLQICLNLFMLGSTMLRRAYPSATPSMIGYFFGITVFLLCTSAFASLLWVPSEYLTTASLQGGPSKTLTSPSGTLTYIIYIPLIINALASLLVLIPTNLLNKLMNHLEYAKVNKKIERELLAGLLRESAVESRLRYVRFASPLPIMLSAAILAISLIGLVSPGIYYPSGVGPLVPKTYLRLKLGLELVYTIVTFVAAIAAVVVTFRRVRVSQISGFAFVLLACGFASAYGIYMWAAALTRNDLIDKAWPHILIPLHSLLLASLLLIVVTLLALRKALLEQVARFDVTALGTKMGSAQESYGSINYSAERKGYAAIASDDSSLSLSSDQL